MNKLDILALVSVLGPVAVFLSLVVYASYTQFGWCVIPMWLCIVMFSWGIVHLTRGPTL